MYKLRQEEFEKTRQLFTEVNYQLSADAVIDGNNPGTIWVDDIDNPRCALMNAPEGYIIVGNPYNHNFNRQVADLFIQVIYPEGLKSNLDSWDIYYDPKWEESLLHEMMKDKLPMKHPRMHFVLKELEINNWRTQIPSGFELVQIDEKFLQQKHLKNFEQVETRVDEWGSEAQFLSKGFGFCIVHNNTIVSRCMADCVSGNRCEIGIATDPDYRKRGFASLTVAATIDSCLQDGITRIGWHCSAYNKGSQKTALRVGFEMERNYFNLWAHFNEFDNYISNAYHHLYQERDPETGEEFINAAVTMGKIEEDHWYGWARGFALCRNLEKTIEYISKAFAYGWNNKERLLSDEYLQGLPVSREEIWNRAMSL